MRTTTRIMGSRVRVPSPLLTAVMRQPRFALFDIDSRERPAFGPVVELAYTASSNLAAYGDWGFESLRGHKSLARVVELADTTV